MKNNSKYFCPPDPQQLVGAKNFMKRSYFPEQNKSKEENENPLEFEMESNVTSPKC